MSAQQSSIVHQKPSHVEDCWVCGKQGLHQYFDRSVGQVYCTECVGDAATMDQMLFLMFRSHPRPDADFNRGLFYD
jgi:hypothetical protein